MLGLGHRLILVNRVQVSLILPEEIKEKYGIRAVRPLAPKTMERIARGLKKFVIDNAEPFVVQVNHSGANMIIVIA